MFRCRIKDCNAEFEDEGDLGMHLIFGHGLGEEINEQGETVTQEMRAEELRKVGLGGLVDEIDRNRED